MLALLPSVVMDGDATGPCEDVAVPSRGVHSAVVHTLCAALCRLKEGESPKSTSGGAVEWRPRL